MIVLAILRDILAEVLLLAIYFAIIFIVGCSIGLGLSVVTDLINRPATCTVMNRNVDGPGSLKECMSKQGPVEIKFHSSVRKRNGNELGI